MGATYEHVEGHGSDKKMDPLTKKAMILHRRQEENLPFFGELVEHADEKELRYHEHEDARNIELFFDLFFVAIFSTFTKNHEINSNEALSSYAVYFGVIWASWLQISLYDVRFGFDSLFERFTKATHFVAFIGFASATGCLDMNPSKEKIGSDLSGFESLNVLMIVTRVIFSIQYGVAAVLVGRKHRPALIPLAATSAMYAFVSFVYGMLLKFFLLDFGETQSFYGYYAIIAFELFVLSYINSKYSCISFTDTHLHKRTMVLTLMILGEGIIVCAFTFAKISSKTGWTANTFGQALCVILSIVSRDPSSPLDNVPVTDKRRHPVLHLLPVLWKLGHRAGSPISRGSPAALHDAPSSIPPCSSPDTRGPPDVDNHRQRAVQLPEDLWLPRQGRR